MQTEKLKVVFVTMDEPFYVPLYIENALNSLPENIEVLRVHALYPHLSNKTLPDTIKKVMAYFGIVNFTYLVLLRIYYLFADMAKRGLRSNGQFHSLKLVCRKHNIPYVPTSKINSNDVLDELERLKPDVIFAVAAPQIFKENLISIPTHGCLNIHSSLLPAYRGQDANFWVLAKGEKTTGVTIHYITPGIDDGDILLQEKIHIQDSWSLHDLYMSALMTGSAMIGKVLGQIRDGTVSPKKNDVEKGSYFSFPTKADVKEFRGRKRRFFRFH
jgi:methionyl-tRNA formyltransferase